MNTPSTAGDDVNPMLPTTTGALLAEEWTIDPQSTLPSLLEMMMMEEARRSGYEALKSCFSHAEHRLTEIAEAPSETTTADATIFNSSRWSELKKKMARVIVQKLLRPWGPEIRLFLIYLLQRGSLISSNATVSESLYGGKRVKLESPTVKDRKETSNQRRLIPMPKLDAVRLAFLVSFGPYLAERTDILYNDLGPVDGPLTSSSLSQKLQKIYKFAYPFLHMSVQGVHLLEQWKYLLGQSVFFDPYSKWLNLVVRRVTEQDQAQKNSNGHSKKSNSKMLETTLVKSRSMMTNSTLKATALGIVSSALAIGWMARVRATRQELQRRIPSQLRPAGREGRQQHDPLPPPPAPPLAIDLDLASLPATICPLCRQPRINPTASTGGHVFCLKCITAHVRENETCPVTGRECPESMLVRLYEPHTTS